MGANLSFRAEAVYFLRFRKTKMNYAIVAITVAVIAAIIFVVVMMWMKSSTGDKTTNVEESQYWFWDNEEEDASTVNREFTGAHLAPGKSEGSLGSGVVVGKVGENVLPKSEEKTYVPPVRCKCVGATQAGGKCGNRAMAGKVGDERTGLSVADAHDFYGSALIGPKNTGWVCFDANDNIMA